jgi:phosphate transport system substrate-binding protein
MTISIDKAHQWLLFNILIVILTMFFISCTGRNQTPNTITITGSDTMLILNRRWAETYMQTHPGISVYVEGGGTQLGVKALVNGTAEICAASRPLRASEVKLLVEKFSKLGIAHMVAKDALTIYLHPDNPVDNLSLKQIQKIFTGDITNWIEVGGQNHSINVLNRSTTSGTFIFFQEHVLSGEDYTESAVTLPTTSDIVETIWADPYAVGYGGFTYTGHVKPCAVNGIVPSEQNIINNTYPITRYLYLYTVDVPKGQVKKFINWIFQLKAQMIAREMGYFPIWELEKEMLGN